MSILHLVPDRVAAIARVRRLLKPGGRFFSSTVCIKDINPLARLALPVMRLVGAAPRVEAFSADELVRDLKAGGFEIEMTWRPGPKQPVFIIARRPEFTA